MSPDRTQRMLAAAPALASEIALPKSHPNAALMKASMDAAQDHFSWRVVVLERETAEAWFFAVQLTFQQAVAVWAANWAARRRHWKTFSPNRGTLWGSGQ